MGSQDTQWQSGRGGGGWANRADKTQVIFDGKVMRKKQVRVHSKPKLKRAWPFSSRNTPHHHPRTCARTPVAPRLNVATALFERTLTRSPRFHFSG